MLGIEFRLAIRKGPSALLSVLLPVLLLAFPAQGSNAPAITAISDSNPPLSGRIAIQGTSFGAEGDVFIAGQRALTSTWTDTRVVAYVPETAALGPTTLHIVSQGQQSNDVPVTVTSRQAQGRVRWTFEAEGNNLWWRPALAPDGTIYIHTNSATDGLVYALSPDGALLWIQKVNWYPYVPPSAGPDGAVYVGSIGTIYRINANGGIDWQYNPPNGVNIEVAPAVGPDGLLYGAFELSGAFAIEPLTGEVLWENPGDPVMSDKSGDATEMKFGPSGPGQPVDQLYTSMDRTPLLAFSLSGQQLWAASMSNLSGTAEVAIGSDGTLYGPRSLGLQVAAVDPSDGSTLWEYYPHDWAVGTDNVEIGPDDMLYFVGSAAKLEAFDPSTQSRRWQEFTQGTLLERPTISPDGSVLVVHGSYGNGEPGFVKGFNPGNGNELWTVDLAGAPYPEARSLGVHHARITPDSATAYVSTMTLSGSTSDPHATLYAIDLGSGSADRQPPAVSFATPRQGDQLSGVVPIVVDASDNRGLNDVAVSYSPNAGLGQICAGSPGGAPDYQLSCNWDTNGLAPGSYTLSAFASDTAGNSSTDTITVQVGEPATPTLVSSAIDLSAKVRRGVVNVTGQVYVVDQDGAAVRGATVTANWRLPDGTTASQTATSNRRGVAEFSVSGSRGTYTLTVVDISKPGYEFDAANSVLSNSITG